VSRRLGGKGEKDNKQEEKEDGADFPEKAKKVVIQRGGDNQN